MKMVAVHTKGAEENVKHLRVPGGSWSFKGEVQLQCWRGHASARR